MISLIEAVKLLDLDDAYGINFCIKSEDTMNDVYMCVRNIRKYLDMRLVTVYKIGLYHYRYNPDVSLEFVVSPKDLMYIKTICKKNNL